MLSLRRGFAFFFVLTNGCSAAGGAATTEDDPVKETYRDAGPGEGGVADAGADAFAPAAHDPAPQIAAGGGPVMRAPKIVPITFGADPMAPQLEAFATKLTASPFFAQMVEEYGVGAASVAAPVHAPDTAPGPIDAIDDAAVQAWLSKQLDAASLALPAPSDDVLYVLFLPDGSKFHQGAVQGCAPLGGYHSEMKLASGQSAVYSLVGRCGTFQGFQGVDAVTAIATHEILEAATDPHLLTNPAFLHVEDEFVAWELALQQGENGDMCAAFADSFIRPASLGAAMQRTWSNAAAKAGHDPCVPSIPGQAYFAAAPRLEKVALSGGAVRAVNVPVGQTRTIDVDFFSDAPTEPWTISAAEAKPGETPLLSFDVADATGANGHVAHLTIRALKAAEGPIPLVPFLVTATQGQRQTFWIGGVTN